MLILVVDDERSIRASLKRILEDEGYRVKTAASINEAMAILVEGTRPDLVLLDFEFNSQRYNGIDICKEIRKDDPLLPIVFLTNNAGERNEVTALKAGADDFVSKLADIEVLLKRIDRAIQRNRIARSLARETAVLALGKVQVDLGSFTVRDNGSKIAELTKMEAMILKTLADSRGEWVAQESLINTLQASGSKVDTTSLRTHVYNLRTSLGAAGDMVRSGRQVGYMLIGNLGG